MKWHAYCLPLLLVVVLGIVACGVDDVGYGGGSPSEPDHFTVATSPPRDIGTSIPHQVGGRSLDLPDVPLVVEKVRSSVVSVVTEVEITSFFGDTSRDFQSGSGVIFDDEGYILTNNHVIENGSSIVVRLDSGLQLDATVVGSDPDTDLAVLKVEKTGLPYLEFADPSTLRVGDWVIAIGNALNLPGGPSVTLGIVSAKDRSFQPDQSKTLYDLIQTDTVINPGNSGGPLLNLAGEIVGINTAVLRGSQIEGIGFAIGGETAILVSGELIKSGEILWPWIGVFISDLTAEQASERDIPQKGIFIAGVLSGGPALDAGLQTGDVMVSISGEALDKLKDLTRALRFNFSVGDQVVIEVWRDGEIRAFDVALTQRPST